MEKYKVSFTSEFSNDEPQDYAVSSNIEDAEAVFESLKTSFLEDYGEVGRFVIKIDKINEEGKLLETVKIYDSEK